MLLNGNRDCFFIFYYRISALIAEVGRRVSLKRRLPILRVRVQHGGSSEMCFKYIRLTLSLALIE